jgi:hypothetical protein
MSTKVVLIFPSYNVIASKGERFLISNLRGFKKLKCSPIVIGNESIHCKQSSVCFTGWLRQQAGSP